VPRTVLQSLMSSLVLSRLDYGNATLSGISGHLVQRLQSVMKAAARMIYATSRCLSDYGDRDVFLAVAGPRL